MATWKSRATTIWRNATSTLWGIVQTVAVTVNPAVHFVSQRKTSFISTTKALVSRRITSFISYRRVLVVSFKSTRSHSFLSSRVTAHLCQQRLLSFIAPQQVTSFEATK